jgi:hypothetical protein
MRVSLPRRFLVATLLGPVACGVQVHRNRCSSASERALESHRNRCSSATGISVQVAPEYAVIPIRPGYSLGPESADVVARLQVRRRRPDELLPGVVLTVGVPSYRYELTLQLMAPASVVEVITISFVAKDGSVEPDQVSDILNTLSAQS